MALLRKNNDKPPALTQEPDVVVDDSTVSTGSAGKGKATPKRRDAEAANKRPLVPSDRKAAARDARDKSRADRARAYQGQKAGDERYLAAKDKGADRRYVRDHVDARWNLGEFFLPVALVLFVTMLFAGGSTYASVYTLVALYSLVIVAIFDTFLMWRGLRKRLKAKFGEVRKGTVMYASLRAFQIRRARLPKPAHKKHGVYPE
ncbi:DUF3043 domain-containing protein [Luteimicrobium subarcticum]|uniref:DUF3043 family protein n=1 Tax=Luteimicrobium subarcticum TaxID=620910 RepID=A0A2M8WRE5_9MICO|nr:DUF3043 domain-containing protein [Luteimicrobium subarcticum]PJI93474.1 Protein of unknown function (DUF3043) [Luteimicrobium subarcticum]